MTRRIVHESLKSRLKRTWANVRRLIRGQKHDPSTAKGVQYSHQINLRSGVHLIKKEQR